eukprot:TRINITY_DN2067_c0_g1_i1.p1 TRINITY_DN2067_c0_g1~~TRINITY_DN2067_c0_g1_i1.p1  ORF type:complete len:362 (+),score=120.53 TRINITY_DN2067_c0_g1_i1:102-1088(+)
METDAAAAAGAGAENGAAKPKPDWLSKIQEGGIKKPPKDVLKRRRNFRLGRMVAPKQPMVALQELIRQEDITFESYISDPMSRLWKIGAMYDGQKFEGVGPTKNIARNICCENVLQYIAFKACEKDSSSEMPKGSQGEEHKPWTALASVALFKMFNDWAAQGALVPPELMKTVAPPANNAAAAAGAMEADAGGAAPGQPQMMPMAPWAAGGRPGGAPQMSWTGVPQFGGGQKPAKQKKPRGPAANGDGAAEKPLPADAATKHPVAVLNEMLGAQTFDFTQDGAPPNHVYICTVNVNGTVYTGSAKSKKEAKKMCAKDAMLKIYNIACA